MACTGKEVLFHPRFCNRGAGFSPLSIQAPLGTMKSMKKSLRVGRRILIFSVMLVLFSPESPAQNRRAPSPASGSALTYDIGASTGQYNGQSYTEIDVGLSWRMLDWLIWRNAVFNRSSSGGASTFGLDSSLRAEYSLVSTDQSMAMTFFGGPGVRVSKTENSASFVEAGFKMRLGGLSLGAGAKSFSYFNPGNDPSGRPLPKGDTVYFLILSGGGSL